MLKNSGCNHFVDENPPVLRVILEFDDVKAAVVGFQQMCLRAAPHFADETGGVYGHGIRREWKFAAREKIT